MIKLSDDLCIEAVRMSKNSDQVSEERLELYKKLLDTHPEIELKGGMKLPYTSHNGNMYTMLSKDGRIGIRLGKEDFKVFIEKYDAIQFKNYGANMREYVEVPESLLENMEELAPYLAKSHEYVQTLKPKPKKKWNLYQ